jgi:transposase
MQTDNLLKEKYNNLLPFLNEKERRLVLAADAISMGHGGLSKVSVLTGVSRVTINAGVKDLKLGAAIKTEEKARSRKQGGGRKKEIDKDVTLKRTIEEVVSPYTLGDPMNPLLWTSKSLRHIADILEQKGYTVSHKLIGETLKEIGYSLQGNRKTDEGSSHVDRDKQFNYINDIAKAYLEVGDPVISVDCKKKELIGNYKNAGKGWHKKGEPTEVKVYDFIDKKKGKAVPYGVYDIGNNEGWVSVGISSDTASFAVSTIRSWWDEMGKERFTNSKRMFITADGGGSNSSRSRLWKKELQLLADDMGMEIQVSHFPPGTSKWNKIEHRLFSYISQNWKEQPLTSLQLIVDLIASTRTDKGLIVKAKKDEKEYKKGVKVTNKEMEAFNINKSDFHGEWNYTIKQNIVQFIS